MKTFDGQIPRERTEFLPDTHWIIIKKWDRGWRKLRVISRLNRYIAGIEQAWANFWRSSGGEASPYTLQWIHYDNLVDAYRLVFRRNPDNAQVNKWDHEFPAVSIIRRAEQGEPPTRMDAQKLAQVMSAWSRRHIHPLHLSLKKEHKNIDDCAAVRTAMKNFAIEQLAAPEESLFAAFLAQDIRIHHQQALPILEKWRRDWERHLVPLLKLLGNETYIHGLRAKMPLHHLGDPDMERERKAEARRLSRHTPQARTAAAAESAETPEEKRRMNRRSPWGYLDGVPPEVGKQPEKNLP